MGITVEAPRGGLVENLAGVPRVMILRNAEIERFEDQHGGIFQVWDGFVGRSPKPRSDLVRDLVALGLVGGGMTDEEADRLVSGLGPAHLLGLYAIAQALVGIAFTPDAVDEGEDAPDEDGGADPEKKT